jgi:hypothetical protein
MFFPAADVTAVSTGGTERMRITSTGNVGIGTGSPTAFLHAQRTSGTTQTIGLFEAAVGGFTGTSLVAANTLGPDSSFNLFSCISDSDADAGGPYTEFMVRGDGLLFMDSGYGSAGAAYGCRAWVNFNGDTAGAPAIRASGNVSSITDNGAGRYAINFTTAMPDANYGANVSVSGQPGVSDANFITTDQNNTVRVNPTTSSFAMTVFRYQGTPLDADFVRVSVFR